MPITRTWLVLGGGTTAAAIAYLTPTMNWALDGFPRAARPENTGAVLAAFVVIGATAFYHAVRAAYALPSPISAAPTANPAPEGGQ